MKTFKLLPFLLFPAVTFAQETYKGLPVLKANTLQAGYRIGT